MDAMPIDAALEWYLSSPGHHHLFIAATCPLYAPKQSDEEQNARRVSPVAKEVFKVALNKKEVFQEYIPRLMPMSWSGSRADKLRQRLGILDDLLSLGSGDDARIVANERIRLMKIVSSMKEQEEAEERASNEKFE